MQEVGRAEVYGNPAVATPDAKAESRTILLWAHHSAVAARTIMKSKLNFELM